MEVVEHALDVQVPAVKAAFSPAQPLCIEIVIEARVEADRMLACAALLRDVVVRAAGANETVPSFTECAFQLCTYRFERHSTVWREHQLLLREARTVSGETLRCLD